MKISRILGALAVVMLVVSAAPVQAQLEYSLTPYLWATGLDGSIGIGDRAVDLDWSFSDITDNLEIAGLLHFEAQGPVFGLIAEGVFLGLGQDVEAIPGAKVDVDNLMFELLSSWDWTPAVQVIFGARYVELDTEIQLPAVGPVAGPTKLSTSQKWVDPVVGLRYGGQLNRRGTWNSNFRADFAGFGLGDGSELTWNVRVNLGYKFNDTVALWGGYHWMDIDYDNKGFVYDVLQQGPEIGLMFSW
jgi:hypothetical protein